MTNNTIRTNTGTYGVSDTAAIGPLMQGQAGVVMTFTLTDLSGTAVNLTGLTITGTITNNQTKATAALQGAIALVTPASGIFSWTTHADDVGTAGSFKVIFTVGTSLITLPAHLAIIETPAATTTFGAALVGVTVAEAAWLTAALAALPDAGDLANVPDPAGATEGYVWTADGANGADWAAVSGISLSDYSNVIVVDAGGNGDYTTLSAGIAAASDGDLIITFGKLAEVDAITCGKNLTIFSPGYHTIDVPVTITSGTLRLTGQPYWSNETGFAVSGGALYGMGGTIKKIAATGGTVFARDCRIATLEINNVTALYKIRNAWVLSFLFNATGAFVTSYCINSIVEALEATTGSVADQSFMGCEFGSTPADVAVKSGNYTNTLNGVTWPTMLFSPLRPTQTDITGTTHTFTTANEAQIVTSQSGSATTFTIPLNSSQAFPVGSVVGVEQHGAGALTITATAGVTLNGTDGASKSITAQWGAAAIRKTSTNGWIIIGAIS